MNVKCFLSRSEMTKLGTYRIQKVSIDLLYLYENITSDVNTRINNFTMNVQVNLIKLNIFFKVVEIQFYFLLILIVSSLFCHRI